MDTNGENSVPTDRNLPYSASPDVIIENHIYEELQPKLYVTPSFKETNFHLYRQRSYDSDDEPGQIFKQFDIQKADFESKSAGSETASEGR